MHGVITVVLVAWMLWKEQMPFRHGYTAFSKKGYTVLGALLPIVLITFGYMAWTYIGQSILNESIYQNVIDWNHTGLTFATFGRTAAGFLVITALYWFSTWVSSRLCPCGKTKQNVLSENNIEQPLLPGDTNSNKAFL